MSTFILAPGDPPASETLNLLPFSLTPLPAHAATGTYFRPRPGPDGSVAAFRGRQVVGQSIAVPPGYRGVVLRVPPAGASRGAGTGAGASAGAGGGGRGGPGVLTPATSFVSSGTKSTRASTPATELEAADTASPRAQRAAARARGSGQVAVARTRRRAAVPRKRIRLDESDDESGDVVAPMKRAPQPTLCVASGERAGEDGEGEGDEEEGQVGRVVAVDDMDVDEGAPEIVLAPAPTSTCTATATDAATTTSTTTATSATTAMATAGSTDARVLVPTASFSHIVLWTPDAPLAGFDPHELDERGKVGRTDETGPTTDAAKPDVPKVTALERGWWRTGGAGEGGDEFVRALGEWLGLGEVIHKPLYADDDGDDDE